MRVAVDSTATCHKLQAIERMFDAPLFGAWRTPVTTLSRNEINSWQPPMTVALRCRGLVKRYGSVTAVAGLDLEVRAGECFGMLGPNGAGKTTSVEMFEGLRAPDGGELEVLGDTWRGNNLALRTRLGIQLQETKFPEKL